MSKKRRIAKAIMAGAALYGLTRPMMGSSTSKATVSDAQKMSQVPKKVVPKKVVDLKNPESSIVNQTTKISVDKNANPKETAELAKKAKEAKAKQYAIVKKRKDEGMLSPTMPKSESQYRAMMKENSGLGMFDMNKGGSVKMIKARGGGMAIQGIKPTKLY
jgi:hypothetical protein|tara:strand:+ start:336 stop:818 length:483 start_codon:yes stop_codon:yes gene_type:complete